MKIILSTTNPSKSEQIKAALKGLPVEVETLREAGISGEGKEESDVLVDNATSKARYAHDRGPKGSWALSDDTGFFINCLNGEPGAKAARWAGDVPTEEITRYTLSRMKGAEDRSAYFECVAVLISPEGEERVFKGRVDGHVLESARTKPQPKMPYSCIFVPNGHAKVWAEMDVSEENAISHRGKAFSQVKEFLKSVLGEKPAV